jgi:hypothetical protein
VLALYYAEVAEGGSRLRKYIVLHPGRPRVVPPSCVADAIPLGQSGQQSVRVRVMICVAVRGRVH